MSDMVPQVYSTFIYTDIVSRMESGIGMDALMLILLSTLFTVVFSDECTVKNVSFISIHFDLLFHQSATHGSSGCCCCDLRVTVIELKWIGAACY